MILRMTVKSLVSIPYILILSYYEIDRADPVLIQVIKELGEEAYGDFSKLEIVDLPEGTYYRIDEYDGLESVLTIDDYEWKKA